MGKAFSKIIFILFVYLVMPFSTSSWAHSYCESVFATDSARPTSGTSLGPIDWLTNIKLKIRSSNTLKNFNDQKYQNAFDKISQEKLSIKEGFAPASLEESIAYLDVSLAELNLSILKMEPIIRNKIFKIVQKTLLSQNRGIDSAAPRVASLIFRGAYQKPTSFKFLLTHLPKDVSAEIFTQQLHELAITEIVVQAFNFKPQSKVSRLPLRWAKEHKEIINVSLFAAFDVVNTVMSGIFVPILTPFNILKLKKNKVIIEEHLTRNGLDKTLMELGPEFSNKNQFNYYYAVIEKVCNWYFIGYILAPFFIAQ